MKSDAQEGPRFAFGCTAVLVALGMLLAAFLAGVWSTYRSYRADPEGFKNSLEEEYRILEERAQQAAQPEPTPPTHVDSTPVKTEAGEAESQAAGAP